MKSFLLWMLTKSKDIHAFNLIIFKVVFFIRKMSTRINN